MLLEQGKASQALAYLDKALEIDPEHGQALLNSAILLQEFGRPELRSIARERLLKLLAMNGKVKSLLLLLLFFIQISVLAKKGNKKEEVPKRRRIKNIKSNLWTWLKKCIGHCMQTTRKKPT